jgi:hypothetical protein
MVGDACLRALGLPTPPPPDTTVELWVRLWLDRLLDVIAFDDESTWPRTWNAVAALHPAAPGQPTSPLANRRSTRAASALSDGSTLADATVQLAAAWPWSRLRADPEVIDTARPPLSRHLAGWMDDGMFARWLVDATDDIGPLSTPLSRLLPAPVVAGIAETVTTLGFAWPPPAPSTPPADPATAARPLLGARPATPATVNGEVPR